MVVLRWAFATGGLALVAVIVLAIIFSHYIMLYLMMRFIVWCARTRERRST